MTENGNKQLTEAYLDLLSRHGRIAQAIARLYTLPGEDQADLEQEIRLQWWRSLAGFSGHAKVSTWLYQVALHTALTFQRRRVRRIRSDSLERAESVPDPVPHPWAQENQRRRALQWALSKLEPGERALAYLWLEECAYEEIAAITGLNTNAVGVRLHRLRNRLKELLTGREEER